MTTDPNLLAVGTSVAALAAAIQAASPLSTNTLVALGKVVQQAQATLAAADAAVAANDAKTATSGVFGIVAGGYGPALAAQLVSQVAATTNATALLGARASVGRVLVNLTVTGG